MSSEKDQKRKRAEVETELLKANATLHALGVTIIEHEGEQSNVMIGKRMNEIASCYQKIDELSEKIDLHVPFDILQYLDEGKNPQEFTRDYLERAASENQFTKGKLSIFQDFASILKEEMLSGVSDFEEVKTEPVQSSTILPQ